MSIEDKCGVVWWEMGWCGMVWCGVMWYGVVWGGVWGGGWRGAGWGGVVFGCCTELRAYATISNLVCRLLHDKEHLDICMLTEPNYISYSFFSF